VELYLHSQYAFMAWSLVKHRDNFTFTFLASDEIASYFNNFFLLNELQTLNRPGVRAIVTFSAV
jgi:hypothetical protein